MSNIKKLYIGISSLSLLALTFGLMSCSLKDKFSNNNNNNSSNNNVVLNNSYTRTIPKEQNINVFSGKTENLGKYDFNTGVSSYPAVGEINEQPIPNETSKKTNEELFTVEEVQTLTDEIYNEYNKSLESTSSNYEKQLTTLAEDYLILENEYLNLLDNISKNENQIDKTETITTEEVPNNTVIEAEENEQAIEESKPFIEENKPNVQKNKFNSREEEIDNIYNKALETASKNLGDFEPIQGQAPKTNSESEISTSVPDALNSEIIFNELNQNIFLPKYVNKNSSNLISDYGLNDGNFSDFKLISSEIYDENYFEMLLIKPLNISEEDLTLKIKNRIDSIINKISENTKNEINLDDKILLLNIDDYILFCFSNITNDILEFLII